MRLLLDTLVLLWALSAMTEPALLYTADAQLAKYSELVHVL